MQGTLSSDKYTEQYWECWPVLSISELLSNDVQYSAVQCWAMLHNDVQFCEMLSTAGHLRTAEQCCTILCNADAANANHLPPKT